MAMFARYSPFVPVPRYSAGMLYRIPDIPASHRYGHTSTFPDTAVHVLYPIRLYRCITRYRSRYAADGPHQDAGERLFGEIGDGSLRREDGFSHSKNISILSPTTSLRHPVCIFLQKYWLFDPGNKTEEAEYTHLSCFRWIASGKIKSQNKIWA